MAYRTKIYDLTKHTVSFEFPDALKALLNTNGSNGNSLVVGGQGSGVSNIVVHRNSDIFETLSDKSGGYAHSKSYDKTGTVTLTINQLSEDIIRLINICGLYQNNDIDDGITITVNGAEGGSVAECVCCVPANIPDQEMGESATTQQWIFNCGAIDFPTK